MKVPMARKTAPQEDSEKSFPNGQATRLLPDRTDTKRGIPIVAIKLASRLEANVLSTTDRPLLGDRRIFLQKDVSWLAA